MFRCINLTALYNSAPSTTTECVRVGIHPPLKGAIMEHTFCLLTFTAPRGAYFTGSSHPACAWEG